MCCIAIPANWDIKSSHAREKMTKSDQETRGCGNSGKIAAGFPAENERHELIDSGASTARPSSPSDARQSLLA
jgi:hypothetical protein